MVTEGSLKYKELINGLNDNYIALKHGNQVERESFSNLKNDFEGVCEDGLTISHDTMINEYSRTKGPIDIHTPR